MQGGDGADASGPPRGNPARQEPNGKEQQNNRDGGERVVRRDAPKLADNGARHGEADEDADGDARYDNSEAMLQNHLQDIAGGSAEGHTNADFVRAARRAVSNHAIDAESYEKQANRCESGHEKKAQARLRVGERVEPISQRLALGKCDRWINRPNSLAHSRVHRAGIARRAHKKPAHSRASHAVRYPQLGFNRILEAYVHRVGSHANDLERAIRDGVGKLLQDVENNRSAKRITVSKKAALKRLVDDHHFSRGAHLRFRKRAASDKRMTDDGEIVLADQLDERLPFAGVGLAGNFDIAAEPS